MLKEPILRLFLILIYEITFKNNQAACGAHPYPALVVRGDVSYPFVVRVRVVLQPVARVDEPDPAVFFRDVVEASVERAHPDTSVRVFMDRVDVIMTQAVRVCIVMTVTCNAVAAGRSPGHWFQPEETTSF